MDMRGGFMMRPRERGPMMRPAFPPLRGRGPMMDRLRVLPPRPALMRGAPPAFGRPVGMPPGRPRVLGPVMLPRPPMPPPGALGPPGPRGMLPPPRPMLGPPPPRPLPPDMMDGYMPNLPLNKDANTMQNKMNQNVDNVGSYSGNRDMRNNRVVRNNQTVMPQGGPGLKKNRKDNKNRRVQPSQVVQPTQIPQAPPIQNPVQSQHQPVQNVHHGIHQMPQGPNSSLQPQQNSMHMNQPPAQKHVPPMQSQYVPSQSAPVPHQNSVRGVRNNMPHRNRGNAHVGNRGNAPMNYPPNIPNQMPPRPAAMMNGPSAGPQPVVQYSNAPPPSYPVPPPQVPMKRAAPPAVNPPQQPVMPPPKRVRYDAPVPSNGYAPAPSYQQLPPQQQSSYTMNYEMPPPTSAPVQQTTDMYGNMAAPNANMAPVQNYGSADYGNYQVPPSTAPAYNVNGNTQYANSTYTANQQPYSNSYSAVSYDTNTDYGSVPAQTMPTADPYAGYSKPVSTVDSYGYNNNSYNTQPAYDEYSSGYADNNGYSQPVPAAAKEDPDDGLMNGGALTSASDVFDIFDDCDGNLDNDLNRGNIEPENNVHSCSDLPISETCSYDPDACPSERLVPFVNDQFVEVFSKDYNAVPFENHEPNPSVAGESSISTKQASVRANTYLYTCRKENRKKRKKRMKKIQRYVDRELTELLIKKSELQRQLNELRSDRDSCNTNRGSSDDVDQNGVRYHSSIFSCDCRDLENSFSNVESNQQLLHTVKSEPRNDYCENDANVVEEGFSKLNGVKGERCEESTNEFSTLSTSVHEFNCECLTCSKEHSALLQSFHDTLEMMNRASET